jgi:hypothetical protein
LVKEFIQIRKRVAKDKENTAAEDESWELEDKLKEKGLVEEDMNKIINYCDRLVEQLERLQLQAQVEIPF